MRSTERKQPIPELSVTVVYAFRDGVAYTVEFRPIARRGTRRDRRQEDHPIPPESRSSERRCGQGEIFEAVGFSLADWTVLQRALLAHANNNLVTGQTSIPFGEMFEVSCNIHDAERTQPVHHFRLDD